MLPVFLFNLMVMVDVITIVGIFRLYINLYISSWSLLAVAGIYFSVHLLIFFFLYFHIHITLSGRTGVTLMII